MIIPLSKDEAVLLDWVLTLHTFDLDLLGRLVSRYWQIRYEVAKVLIGESQSIDVETGDEFDEVLTMVPILFSIGGENIGGPLKEKLYRAKIGSMGLLDLPDIFKEVGNGEPRKNPREDEADAEDSS